MQKTSRLNVGLIAGLASLVLLYPAIGIASQSLGGSDTGGIGLGDLGPLAAWLWLLIGATWVLVVWLTRCPRPVVTLVLSGVGGGIITLAIAVIAQLVTAGTVGVLTAPMAIVMVVAMNALGGLVCGLIAAGLQAVSLRRSHA